jgi:hypothetical protein
MTLSHKDLQISFNSITDTKLIRKIFSNFLISSAILVLLLILIFNVNYGNYVSTFLYGYGAVIFYNIITAKYIKEDYAKKNESFLDNDFGSMTRNAGINRQDINIVKRGESEPNSEDLTWEKDNNFEQDINDFLNN